MPSSLKENLAGVLKNMAMAANAVGKMPEDITLVAVTKTFPVSVIHEAIQAGVRHIGENRIQEAAKKLPEIQLPVTRHLIGHLQRNKVKYAVKLFDMIQSVDSVSLAEEINARCAKINKTMPVLIEVNTSGEASKFGCHPGEAATLLKAIDRLPNLIARGFMTIAILNEDPEKVKPCFQQLKEIYEESKKLSLKNSLIDTLSMGMSSDYELAIREGATMVRIGSAIFGNRIG